MEYGAGIPPHADDVDEDDDDGDGAVVFDCDRNDCDDGEGDVRVMGSREVAEGEARRGQSSRGTRRSPGTP